MRAGEIAGGVGLAGFGGAFFSVALPVAVPCLRSAACGALAFFSFSFSVDEVTLFSVSVDDVNAAERLAAAGVGFFSLTGCFSLRFAGLGDVLLSAATDGAAIFSFSTAAVDVGAGGGAFFGNSEARAVIAGPEAVDGDCISFDATARRSVGDGTGDGPGDVDSVVVAARTGGGGLAGGGPRPRLFSVVGDDVLSEGNGIGSAAGGRLNAAASAAALASISSISGSSTSTAKPDGKDTT